MMMMMMMMQQKRMNNLLLSQSMKLVSILTSLKYEEQIPKEEYKKQHLTAENVQKLYCTPKNSKNAETRTCHSNQ